MAIDQQLLDELADELRTLEARLERNVLQDKTNALIAAAQEVTQELEERITEFESLVVGGGLVDTLSDRIEEGTSALSEALEVAGREIENELASTIAEGFETLNGLLGEDLPDAAEQIASQVTDVLDDAKDATIDAVQELGDDLIEDVGDIARDLVSAASGRLVDAIGNAAETALETVAQDTADGLMKIFLSAQLSLALQPVIAPVTPQLIILKPAVPAIKSALEALP